MAAHPVIDALRAGKRRCCCRRTRCTACAPLAEDEAAVRGLYELKGRGAAQPTALLAASVDALLELVPELRGRPAAIVRACSRGGTRSFSRTRRERFPWLNGASTETIGVRVADVPTGARNGYSTRSARSPLRVRTIPASRRPRVSTTCPNGSASRAAAELDAGRLPGVGSTVIDFTREEPVVLRAGAAPSAEAIARATSARF